MANSVASLWRAVTVTTCYSQITHPPDLKEQVIPYLDVFTGMLAVPAFSYSHTPTYTKFNRLHRAVSSIGISVLSLAVLSIFCKIIFWACQVNVVSQPRNLEPLLSLLKKQNSWFSGSEDTGDVIKMTATMGPACFICQCFYKCDSNWECGKQCTTLELHFPFLTTSFLPWS